MITKVRKTAKRLLKPWLANRRDEFAQATKRPSTIGNIDIANKQLIAGWVMPFNLAPPKPESFYLVVSGKVVSIESISLHTRNDLRKYSVENTFGFKLVPAKPIKRLDQVSLFYRIAGTDYVLGRSPKLISDSHRLTNEIALKSSACTELCLSFDISSRVQPAHSELPDNVGLLSPQDTAVVGYNGYLFLYGGSNKVDASYNDSWQRTKSSAQDWVNKLEERANYCDASGIDYVHLTIPEKQSVLPDFYIRPVPAGTSRLQQVEKKADHNHYVSGLEVLQLVANDAFSKTDSHCTPQGCFALFKAILARLSIQFSSTYTFRKFGSTKGDLANKFKAFDYNERATKVVEAPRRPKLIEKRIPKNKAHIGRRFHFSQPEAQFDKKVLVFGNSFFGDGNNPNSLTWWFARHFKEVVFVWDPNMETEVIDEYSPDIVITQTIERFMRIPPKR